MQQLLTITTLTYRTKLDLFANVVHCKTIDGVPTRHENIDLVVIRENTEGEYRQLEHSILDQVCVCVVWYLMRANSVLPNEG